MNIKKQSVIKLYTRQRIKTGIKRLIFILSAAKTHILTLSGFTIANLNFG